MKLILEAGIVNIAGIIADAIITNAFSIEPGPNSGEVELVVANYDRIMAIANALNLSVSSGVDGCFRAVKNSNAPKPVPAPIIIIGAGARNGMGAILFRGYGLIKAIVKTDEVDSSFEFEHISKANEFMALFDKTAFVPAEGAVAEMVNGNLPPPTAVHAPWHIPLAEHIDVDNVTSGLERFIARIATINNRSCICFISEDDMDDFKSNFLTSCFSRRGDGSWLMTAEGRVNNDTVDNDHDSDGNDSSGEGDEVSAVTAPSYVAPTPIAVPKSFHTNDTAESIRCIVANINTRLVEVNRMVAEVVELSKKTPRTDIENQLYRLSQHPMIDVINHYAQYLGIKTKTITFTTEDGVLRELGRVMITIPYDIFQSNDVSQCINVFNLDRMVGDNQAPHVFGNGNVCFGNVQPLLSTTIADGDIETAVNIVITFLGTPNEDDEMGTFATSYPEVR